MAFLWLPPDEGAVSTTEISGECLAERAEGTPLSHPGIDINFNGKAYIPFLPPERHNKVNALYALHSVYEQALNAMQDALVTDNLILSALLELVLYQGVKGQASQVQAGTAS